MTCCKVNANTESGWKEGLARGMSQACTYVMEVQKSLVQIHGKNVVFTIPQMISAFQQGVVQSSLSAGFVYGTYFHVFKACNGEPYANTVATFVTSLFKIPIANSMRLMQIDPQQNLNLYTSGIRIFKNQGVRGLYNGYILSFVEDFIEMEMRNRMFDCFEHWCHENKAPIKKHELGFIGGALSGSLVAFLTTPFDTLRCHLAYQSGNTSNRQIRLFHTMNYMITHQGAHAFYRGANLRATSTGIRMALFYMFLKVL